MHASAPSLAASLLLAACATAPSPPAVEPLDGPDAFLAADVRAVHAAADGAMWFGARDAGVFRFENGDWTQWTAADGLAGDGVIDFAEAADGTLYAAGGGGVSVFDGAGWSQLETPADFRVVFDVHVDGGDLYLGGNPVAARFRDGDWTTWRVGGDGLPGGVAHLARPGADGGVLIGTRRSGLLEVSDDVTRVRFAEVNVRTAVTGPDGALWLGTGGDGILRLADGDADAWFEGPAVALFAGATVWVAAEGDVQAWNGDGWTPLGLTGALGGAEVFAAAPASDGAVLVTASGSRRLRF